MPDHPYAPDVQTLTALLRHRAVHQPDRIGYTFLDRDASSPGAAHDRTYATLDRRARAVAAWLAAHGARGDRALMLFEEGHAFLDALFGCMYAEVLAVPVHPPDPARLDRTLPRLLTVAGDAGVRTVLTTHSLAKAARERLSSAAALRDAEWLAVDQIDEADAEAWVDPGTGTDDIAYLQYTSGSTATPKGVMVSHRNLLHQLADFDRGYDHTPESVIVSWLPATHDLGLVYGRFMPLFVGCRCVFFAASAFMQRPSRWLEALSRFRGTHSPSPNFGFEVAARKAADVPGLDLSSVRVLLNGAEPIREASEARFLDAFAPSGLQRSAITHAMGMSEATAKIMTEPIDRFPARFVHIDAAAYERNEIAIVDRDAPGAVAVASNGSTSGDTRVAIVDPETREILGDDRVGEMWVSGTTVARGYWNNERATAETFGATSRDGQGPFLRTGDLAFVHDGEIYLSGRLKDLIIIRGQNHHPQDLEWSVAGAHEALRPNCSAAFGLNEGGQEQLVLVAEVIETAVPEPEAVFGAVRAALSDHGLAARSIVLMPPPHPPEDELGQDPTHRSKGPLPSEHPPHPLPLGRRTPHPQPLPRRHPSQHLPRLPHTPPLPHPPLQRHGPAPGRTDRRRPRPPPPAPDRRSPAAAHRPPPRPRPRRSRRRPPLRRARPRQRHRRRDGRARGHRPRPRSPGHPPLRPPHHRGPRPPPARPPRSPRPVIAADRPDATDPCRPCGACCAHLRVGFPDHETTASGGAIPAALTEPWLPDHRRMRGTSASPPRCAALRGVVGRATTCTIYSARPTPCRDMAPSTPEAPNPFCDQARIAHGLRPLGER